MRFAVVGATGGTGQEIITQGLAKDHEMVAVVRRPEAITQTAKNLSVVKADIMNDESLAAAFDGCDAVISCLGVGGLFAARKVGTLLSAGTSNVIAAMARKGIDRLVVASSVGVVDDPTEEWVYTNILKPYFFRAMYDDMALMEDRVAESALAWTLVRPPRLVNGPAKGVFRKTIGGNVPRARRLSRADLANEMLNMAETGAHSREIVGLSY
jgi:biliverdin reductase / flavin reductase